MKVVLHPAESLAFSREVLETHVPISAHVFVFLCCALVTVALGWAITGKMETVVRAKGMVRPDANISSIKSLYAGKIMEIHYSPNMMVSAGDVLLILDTRSAEAELLGIQTRLSKLKSKKSGLERIEMALNRSVFSPEDDTGYGLAVDSSPAARWDAFVAEDKRLYAEVSRAMRLLKEERFLPSSATTPRKLRELEDLYDFAALARDSFRASFKSQVLSEIETAAIEIDELMSRADSLRAIIDGSILCAPIQGLVQEVSSLNAGDVLSAGQEVLRILPHHEQEGHEMEYQPNLEEINVELRIRAADVGKLVEGMDVVYRFPALPSHEFGKIRGCILRIDPDVMQTEGGALSFRVTASLEKRELSDRRGRSYPVRIGLETDATVIIEKRPVFFILMDKAGVVR